jgi:hypothetical protein
MLKLYMSRHVRSTFGAPQDDASNGKAVSRAPMRNLVAA